MKFIVAALVVFIAGVGFGSEEQREFNAKELKTLNVKNGSGKVKVSVVDDGKAYVSVAKVDFEKGCFVEEGLGHGI